MRFLVHLYCIKLDCRSILITSKECGYALRAWPACMPLWTVPTQAKVLMRAISNERRTPVLTSPNTTSAGCSLCHLDGDIGGDMQSQIYRRSHPARSSLGQSSKVPALISFVYRARPRNRRDPNPSSHPTVPSTASGIQRG